MASSATAIVDTSNRLGPLVKGAKHDRKITFREVINGLVEDGFIAAADGEKIIHDQRSQRSET
jgi:hypothetical protein